MTVLWYDETDRFWIRDDDGNQYEIREVTEILDGSAFGIAGATVRGKSSLRTTGGRAANRVGEKYKILGNGAPRVMATRIGEPGGLARITMPGPGPAVR